MLKMLMFLMFLQMKLKGVKNDDGVLFSDLIDEEIKVQLDNWIQNGTLGKQTLREKFTEIEDNLISGLASETWVDLLHT